MIHFFKASGMFIVHLIFLQCSCSQTISSVIFSHFKGLQLKLGKEWWCLPLVTSKTLAFSLVSVIITSQLFALQYAEWKSDQYKPRFVSKFFTILFTGPIEWLTLLMAFSDLFHTDGRPGCNIPYDSYIEHVNRLLKECMYSPPTCKQIWKSH